MNSTLQHRQINKNEIQTEAAQKFLVVTLNTLAIRGAHYNFVKGTLSSISRPLLLMPSLEHIPAVFLTKKLSN